MKTKLQSLLDAEINESSPVNPNDGENVGFSLGKNPISSAPTTIASGGVNDMHQMDLIEPATKALPHPLEHSTTELINIYTSIFDYRRKVIEAMKNPTVKASKSKMLALKRIKRRLNALLIITKKVPPLLDHVTLNGEPAQQDLHPDDEAEIAALEQDKQPDEKEVDEPEKV